MWAFARSANRLPLLATEINPYPQASNAATTLTTRQLLQKLICTGQIHRGRRAVLYPTGKVPTAPSHTDIQWMTFPGIERGDANNERSK
jgi:hypothetical protein